MTVRGRRGAGATGAAPAEYSSRLGVPAPAPLTTPAVELAASAAATCAGVSAGFWASRTAPAPAACGVAMDVPDMEAVAVVEV